MDAATFFHRANIFFVNEDYTKAIEDLSYSIEIESKPEFLSHRAACYYKIGKLSDGLADIQQSLKQKPDEVSSIFRHGQILFALKHYADAQREFKKLLGKDRSNYIYQNWDRKCEAELSGASLPLPKETVKPGLTMNGPPPTLPNDKALPNDQGSPKQNNFVGSPQSRKSQKSNKPTPKIEELPELPNPPVQEVEKKTPSIKHSWYQNAQNVYVTIFAKGRQESDVKVEFLEKEFSASVNLEKNEDFLLDLSLQNEINPVESRVEIGKMKVEIIMKKRKINLQWTHLEETDITLVSPSYPTSSKQKKDWSEMDKEIQKELDKDGPEGDEALNGLFKQIYGNANEETRRAMVKSFQTSGGTVLSTNWDEVHKADYEGKDRPSAPEGQKWVDPKKC